MRVSGIQRWRDLHLLVSSGCSLLTAWEGTADVRSLFRSHMRTNRDDIAYQLT
jgi:hypothetical protein